MANKISEEQVKKIASLARLELTETEAKKFTGQLEEVIDYNIEKLNKVETEKVEPLLNVSGLTQVVREDTEEPALAQEEALKNGKKIHNGFFEVEAILES